MRAFSLLLHLAIWFLCVELAHAAIHAQMLTLYIDILSVVIFNMCNISTHQRNRVMLCTQKTWKHCERRAVRGEMTHKKVFNQQCDIVLKNITSYKSW